MQLLTAVRGRYATTAQSDQSKQVMLGIAVVLLLVTALTITAFLYVNPLGRQVLSFETTDASSIAVGDDVRVAGISVGTVTNMSMRRETILIEAEIEDSVFLGSESRVDVRMLTPVGGYAITLIPLGSAPLGNVPISAAQVQVPYSIGDVLQAAPNVTDKVDGGTIDSNLDEVSRALAENPTSVSSMIGGMTSIARVMDEQREQVRTVAALASEYTQTFNANREFVFDLIRQIDLVLSTYNTNHVGFNEAYRLLGEILMTAQPFEAYYLDHEGEVLGAVNQARSVIEGFQADIGPSITNLEALRTELAEWMTPEGLLSVGGGKLMATDICLPVPGRKC